MFTTQPPAAELDLEVELDLGYRSEGTDAKSCLLATRIKEPSGIRMKHLVRELQRMVRRKDCWMVEDWNIVALMHGTRRLERTEQLNDL